MGRETDISWCDSTANLQMGCDGCELWNPTAGIRHCYAGVMTERINKAGAHPGFPIAFDQPRLFPERLKTILGWKDLTGTDRPHKPHLNGLPRLVFLDDMGDTFTESLPWDWLAPHLGPLGDSPHVYMLLTKRPLRMRKFFDAHPCPANFWCYASVTDQPTALARIQQLTQVQAPLLGISAEPLLGEVNILYATARARTLGFESLGVPHRAASDLEHSLTRNDALAPIKHVILGGESGDAARVMDPLWARILRDDCQYAGVPFFFKQWGAWAPLKWDTPEEREALQRHVVTMDSGERMAYVGHIPKRDHGIKLEGREYLEMPKWPL